MSPLCAWEPRYMLVVLSYPLALGPFATLPFFFSTQTGNMGFVWQKSQVIKCRSIYYYLGWEILVQNHPVDLKCFVILKALEQVSLGL